MSGTKLASTMTAADALSVLSRAEVERQGRWESFFRALFTLAGITAALLPLYLLDRGVLTPAGKDQPAMPAQVTGRLTAIGEIVLVRYYFQFAWRCAELVRSSRALPSYQRATTAVLWVVAAGCAVVVVELAVGLGLPASTIYPAEPSISVLSKVHIAVAVVGLLVLGALALVSSPGFWWRRANGGPPADRKRRTRLLSRRASSRRTLMADLPVLEQRWQGVLRPDPPPTPVPDDDGVIICCSGGGIRSASFCLGGLQELQSRGIYDRASAVVGVSGGGYIAAAMHVLRWQPQRDGGGLWPTLDPAAFAERSPEIGWLRRHSRFLFDSPRMATLAGFSILFGMLVNLFWCAVVIGALSWWLGWLLVASGGLGRSEGRAVARYSGDWELLRWAWVLPLLGLGLFVLQRFAARLGSLGARITGAWRTTAVVTAWIGLGLTGLLLVVPWLMAVVDNATLRQGSVWLPLINALGLSQDNPAGTTSVSLVAVVAAILAVVRASLAKSAEAKTPSWISKIVEPLRRVVLPWVALVVIIAAALVLLMTWIAAFMRTPETHNWRLVAIFAGLVGVITVFTDVNWTSLHHFYRERLSYAFLQERLGSGSRPLPYARSVRFSASAPPPGRGPALVTCAVANVSDVEYVPADRRATPFIFDDSCIGMVDRSLPSGMRMPAATYEFASDFRMRDATIPAAMAMSGAAFSPLVGREHRRVAPYRLILALANARLGVWLPNPIWADETSVIYRMIKLRRGVAVRSAWLALRTEEQRFMVDHLLKPSDRLWLGAQLGLHLTRDPDLTDSVGKVTSLIRHHSPLAAGSWLRLSTEERRDLRASPSLAEEEHLAWLGGELDGTVPEWLITSCEADAAGHQVSGARLWRRGWEFIRYILNQPGPYRLFKEGMGSPSLLDRRLYITDGGHYDNLGLVEALRRRPRIIYVLDASNDAANSFGALGEAMATARIDLDCDLTFDPAGMVTDSAGLAQLSWQSGIARFTSDGRETVVHFVKAVKLTSMPLDVEVYAQRHPDFPRTSTGNQFYGEFDLEAYRQLGIESTRGLLDSLASTPEASGLG